jgi:hypothetical protein
MTGPEHYKEAERLLEIADSDLRNDDLEGSNNYIARAQAHATLALAAATALSATVLGVGAGDWYDVAGPKDGEVPGA